MKNKQFLLIFVLFAALALGCSTTVDSSLASASTAKTTSATISTTSATLDSSTGCITNVNTVVDAELPSWIKDNFKCQVIYKDGTNYVFKSANLPNHTSYYYCGSHANAATTCTSGQNPTLWAALPGANYAAGTNVISSQSMVYKIPVTPSAKTGALTGTQAGYASIGITTNGLAVFNNAAAPPDTLSTEANTFDSFAGHPQNSGVYHHHAAVTKVSSTMASATLLGIALDGYAIYDEACNLGTGGANFTPTANAGTLASSTSTVSGDTTTTLDQLHGHTTTTKHFTTATYHYHYMQDTTATIKTLMGSYFKGTPGTISN